MKSRIILIGALISLVLIGFFIQRSSDSRIIFSANNSNDITRIVLRSLDIPDNIPDKPLNERDKIDSLWNYFTTMKMKKVRSFETYTKPTNEWELIFYYDNGGGDSFNILHQGTIVRQEERIYIPAETKIDIDYILQNFQ